ncbi:MAG: putative toxin-antitoxin system toxin component, PIN family [Candidatus Firestonebacteria bacterium RIFOXYA2_FULL_40_8]|nr:MAG: putative toxin-antitoxin system toxin component, PIN family [Candidatus Firestonebacteria bacterium RIFOXYA2_FULL_40_8]
MGKKEVKPSDALSYKRKAVIDTNVFVSAILFRGELENIIRNWKNGTFEFLLSKEVLNEYIRVLHYPKFELNAKEIKEIIDDELLPFITPVITHSNVRVVKNDPSDDKFFTLAVDGKADVIVSGDLHILSIKKYREIITQSAVEFAQGFRKGEI